MQIVSHPDQIPEWVTARIASQQFEPLILACTLDACIVNAAAEALSDNPGDTMLARSLVQAAQEGVELDVTTTRQVCESLIAHVADGTPDGWRSWEALLQLPIPPELRDSAEAAANQHSPEHAMVARVSLELQFGPMALSEDNIQLLKNVLALPKLPDPPSSGDDHIFDITSWSIDSVLTKTQVKAAEMLLDHAPETAELVAACAISAPQSPQKALKQLLADREFTGAVQTIDDANVQSVKGIEIPSWFSDYDDTAYSRFLKLIADHPITEFSTLQLTKLDELADFVETLRLNDGGAVHLHKQTNEVLQELIELTASLYRFDRAVLAGQAAVALERLERWGSAPYWALFDNARERLDVDWRAVNDPEAAARLLMRLFTLGVGHARFAAKSLWEAPISEQAVQTLRDLLPRLAGSPAHERFGALALGSIMSRADLECWTSSEDPVLRAVAAEMIDPMRGDVLSGRFRKLLDDTDGHVQEAAIKHVTRRGLPNLIAILGEIANRPNPGWMCLSCRTVNPPPGNNSCANDRCHRGGANPAMLATNTL